MIQYPETPANWAPLETALSAFPSVQFYIITNPDSGPGPANSQPDANYQANIETLLGHSNAMLLGYVATGFGTRPSADVIQDIHTYLGWNATYGLAGVFLDETMAGLEDLYKSYTAAIRAAAWPNRPTGYVIMNPGEDIGNSDYYELADQIVTFEQTYAEFQEGTPCTVRPTPTAAVPQSTFTGSNQTLSDVVQSIKDGVFKSTYITDLNINETDVYAGFGSDWVQFVADVAT
ncbi:Spherulation-specific family 4 [Roridomyces roridus]|uniref:Spherulation-specific family 4 n=1 Tax=Roridomyces roridus TaxID=1738132 RepID=A0AAD7FXJ1_9AGAR|nr:Spherulation-specific family 4 [Roridomyces roridus]